ETTQLLIEQRKLAKDEAQKGMMASWDCRVSQVVDVNKGLHCFTAKNAKAVRKIEALPERENAKYLVTVARDADLNKAMDDASWRRQRISRRSLPPSVATSSSWNRSCRPA